MQEEKWDVIEPNIWKAEKEGDMLQGVLLEKKENVGPNNSNIYYVENLETGDGIKAVWGSTVLDDRMALVKVGDFIRITYKGDKPNKRMQPTHIFKVERKVL